jgi:hypothetical protein
LFYPARAEGCAHRPLGFGVVPRGTSTEAVGGTAYRVAMSEFASESSQAAQEEGTIGATSETENPALEKDPSDWVSGEDPMTPSQRSYLDTLAKQAGEELPADLNKAEASQHIDRLKSAQDSQA